MPHTIRWTIAILTWIGALWGAGSPSGLATQDVELPWWASLETRSVQAGSVTITITPQPSDTTLTFLVVLDTHSVDLDRYDLSLITAVRTDQGREAQPEAWAAPRGGHHREGTLRFSLTAADGAALLDSETRGFALIIREVGGVPETIVQWSLGSS